MDDHRKYWTEAKYVRKELCTRNLLLPPWSCSVLSTVPQQAPLPLSTPLARVGNASGDAVGAVGPAADLGGLSATVVARIAVAVLGVVLAAVGDDAGVAVVGVDAAQDAAVDGLNVVHDEMASPAVVGAVAAAAGHLAVVVGVEVLDADGSEAVELDDLVRGVERPAANDVRSAAGLLEGALGMLAQ